MILYHGSNVVVNDSKLLDSDKGRDFGKAFYLTEIKEQAERMAIRKKKISNNSKAIVSVFEWNEDVSNLKYLKFNDPNLEWLELIVKCRTNSNYHHDFDIVEGKIADDSVGETILFVLDNIIKKEDALERLKFQKINSQIAFCSVKALNGLKFIKSYEVK